MNKDSNDKRFRIVHEKFGKQQLIKLLDNETKEYASILPEIGGMLFSLEFLFNNKLVPVLDTYTSENELINTLESSFKGSLLHPFPNRIDAGKYTFENTPYQLPVNFPHENNSIHGLVFNIPFEIVEENEQANAAVVKLLYKSNAEGIGYPFKYELTLVYTFEKNKGLSIETIVKNTDSKNIPVGNGWHPYFKLASKVDELFFQFPAIELYEVNNRMLPNGNKKLYSNYSKSRKIETDSFDSCFGLKPEKGMALINIIDPKLQSGISIWQETGDAKYNFLQIYTPSHRESIAIEPMTCIPNALNNSIGLINLHPKKSLSFKWGVGKTLK